jgi:hypothetical protein
LKGDITGSGVVANISSTGYSGSGGAKSGNAAAVYSVGACDTLTSTIISVSGVNGATITIPSGTNAYGINVSLDMGSTGYVVASNVDMAHASADIGEETGWAYFGQGEDGGMVILPPIKHDNLNLTSALTLYLMPPSRSNTTIHYWYDRVKK